MDPHSILSQFNQRHPKAGPMARSQDTMSTQKRPEKRPKLQSSNSSPPTSDRRIATNSRIKQDEKYKMDMYLAFINDALQKKASGNPTPFNELVSQFNIKRASGDPSVPPIQPAQLRLWFSALSHVVSRLGPTHATLVQAIANMPWTALDNATVRSYTILLGNLLSARPEYLSLVLGKIAQGFTYQSGLQALDSVGAEASSSPLTRRVVYDRLHDLLQHLLALIPTLPTTLQLLLLRNFPHKRQSLIAQATYIRNILRISDYCPEAADKILLTIIDRVIQIDVEIQVELEELEEDENGQQEELFEMDPFDVLVGQGGDSSSDSGSEADFSDLSSDAGDDDGIASELPTNLVHIQEMVKKLDDILHLIFEHFAQTHKSCLAISKSSLQQSNLNLPELPPSSSVSSPSPLHTPTPTSTTPPIPTDVLPKRTVDVSPSEKLHTQFYTLLSIFERTILRTFKSRYTQFLVFWFASLDPEFADIFQGMLIDRALFANDPTLLPPSISSAADLHVTPTSTVTRAAAASYVGSLVSRAIFVDRASACRVVKVLCDFMCCHLDAVDEAVRSCGPSSIMSTDEGGSGVIGRAQNTVFYAVAQAAFLIFCFRWRDLLETPEGQGEDDAEAWREAVDAGAPGSVTAAVAGKKWLSELNVLQRVVTSVLNPLKVCSPNVVTQFARVAHATDFLYCYSILESNRRSEHALKSSDGGSRPASGPVASPVHPVIAFGESIATELNTFFPFDPFRLQRSSSYIRGIYREWSSVAIDDDEEEEGDNEMNEDTSDARQGMWEPESDESDDSHAMGDRYAEIDAIQGNEKSTTLGIPLPAVTNRTTDGLGASLDAMSISPAQPVMAR